MRKRGVPAVALKLFPVSKIQSQMRVNPARGKRGVPAVDVFEAFSTSKSSVKRDIDQKMRK